MASPTRPRARPVAELIGGAIDPLVRKRGLARAELMAWWPEIVGEAYAGKVIPERIRWPKDGTAATLTVRCDPAVALQLAHDTDRLRQRLNAYFGFAAVGVVRIFQQPMASKPAAVSEKAPERPLPPDLEKRLALLDRPLRDSLRNLAHGLLAAS
jgi:hypothetical protein